MTKQPEKMQQSNKRNRTNLYIMFIVGIYLIFTFHLNNTVVVKDASEMGLINPWQFSSRSGDEAVLHYDGYQPAPVEQYMLEHAKELNLDVRMPKKVNTCRLWNDSVYTPYQQTLQIYQQEMEDYYRMVDDFSLDAKDLRVNLTDSSHHQVCEHVKLHKDGLPGIFKSSKQLSKGRSGWMEPLLPTMRDPRICSDREKYLMSMQYLVHDFYHICHQLKPTSRTVFVDMGASLSFHKDEHIESPVVKMLNLFAKFGVKFDHIYAYEKSKQDPDKVFDYIPDHLQAAYHWINVGVRAEPDSPKNPYNMLLDNFNEDDFIVVKLDIDTNYLENKLSHQLLTEPRLAKLIDHFYFEHHVNQKELVANWGNPRYIRETVFESLDLFSRIRKTGISIHYWV